MQNQNGFTIVELIVTIFIIAVLGTVSAVSIKNEIFNANYDRSIQEAKALLVIMETIRVSAQSATFNAANNEVSAIYGLLPAGSTVGMLQTLTTKHISVPTKNEFGNGFLLNITSNFSSVTMKVPGNKPYMWGTNVVSGSSTDITLYSTDISSNNLDTNEQASYFSKIFLNN